MITVMVWIQKPVGHRLKWIWTEKDNDNKHFSAPTRKYLRLFSIQQLYKPHFLILKSCLTHYLCKLLTILTYQIHFLKLCIYSFLQLRIFQIRVNNSVYSPTSRSWITLQISSKFSVIFYFKCDTTYIIK